MNGVGSAPGTVFFCFQLFSAPSRLFVLDQAVVLLLTDGALQEDYISVAHESTR